MLILALDTSGDTCSVAVADGEKGILLAEYNFAHQRRLTEQLPGIVDFVLKDAGATLETIDAFAVGLGPGSFTGVRVGVTMAKVWAEVLSKPLYGVCSLDALARETDLGGALGVVAVAPSRKGEVIAAYYASDLSRVGPEVVATERVFERAQNVLGQTWPIIVGECADWVETPADLPGLTKVRSVRASQIAFGALRRYEQGESDDPATLAPLYVAPPPIRGVSAPYPPPP